MSRRRFGCEFEFSASWKKVEDAAREAVPKDRFEVEHNWKKSRASTHWILKTDSTTSAELTTPPCRLEQLPLVCRVARRLATRGLYITKRDGFHVHVSAMNNDPVKMALLWVDVEAGLLSMFPRHRRENEYCKRYVEEDSFPPFDFILKRVNEHHSILSHSSFNTFEFRVCEGTTDPELIAAWVRFCVSFVSHASQQEPAREPVGLEVILKRLRTPWMDYRLFMRRREMFS